VKGELEQGLIFCGENVSRIHEMTTVPELMRELTQG
jgi:nitronate monooxygenase